jgi:hypothetical protein
MVVMKIRCPRVAEQNFFKEMEDCDEGDLTLEGNWANKLKELMAGPRACINRLETRSIFGQTLTHCRAQMIYSAFRMSSEK